MNNVPLYFRGYFKSIPIGDLYETLRVELDYILSLLGSNKYGKIKTFYGVYILTFENGTLKTILELVNDGKLWKYLTEIENGQVKSFTMKCEGNLTCGTVFVFDDCKLVDSYYLMDEVKKIPILLNEKDKLPSSNNGKDEVPHENCSTMESLANYYKILKKDLSEKLDAVRKAKEDLERVQGEINSLRARCTHKFEYSGRDSHNSYERCIYCELER